MAARELHGRQVDPRQPRHRQRALNDSTLSLLLTTVCNGACVTVFVSLNCLGRRSARCADLESARARQSCPPQGRPRPRTAGIRRRTRGPCTQDFFQRRSALGDVDEPDLSSSSTAASSSVASLRARLLVCHVASAHDPPTMSSASNAPGAEPSFKDQVRRPLLGCWWACGTRLLRPLGATRARERRVAHEALSTRCWLAALSSRVSLS